MLSNYVNFLGDVCTGEITLLIVIVQSQEQHSVIALAIADCFAVEIVDCFAVAIADCAAPVAANCFAVGCFPLAIVDCFSMASVDRFADPCKGCCS